MPSFIGENDILLIGKHKGRSIQDVIKTDPQYLKWLSSRPFAEDDKRIQELYKKNYNPNNPIMEWGKYKGKSLTWIYATDDKYLEWLSNSDYVRVKMPDLKKCVDKIIV